MSTSAELTVLAYCGKITIFAGMMELVDMRDLGSRASGVGVRVPMPAPFQSKLFIACSFSFYPPAEFLKTSKIVWLLFQ